MIDVAVVIPWREGERDRQQALDWTRARYTAAFPDIDIILGRCDPDYPFNRAEAMIDGARRSTASIIIVSDGDVWCDAVGDAIAAVEHGEAWAIPHLMLCRLSEAATARVLAGDRPEDQDDFAERPYKGFEAGTLFVIGRDLLLSDEGSPDTRCRGWGHEEQIHALKLRCFVGAPWRGKANLYHLHHAPQPRKNRAIGNDKNLALYRRYKLARNNQVRMRTLIEESKSVSV